MIYQMPLSNGIEIVGECCLELEMIEKYNVVIIVLTGDLKGREYKSVNYFDALNNLRFDLEKEGVFLVCNGSLKNFYMSNMSLDMSDGLVGYELFFQQQATRKDRLKTFEMDGDIADLSSVEQQKDYYEKWKISILNRHTT
jgi:hypothetical protein